MKLINAKENYDKTREIIGYVPRKKATQADYDRIGFMSGLEVHQQLLTKKKLFCHCPAGKFNHSDDYDAEIVRHMRPTLSELGEYDGTALMEFKTRKEIVYRIKNETACTYEVDDTPPFKIDREALGIALEITLLNKMNVVGEVHITRKQYLDGSIPTGFQRTAILGVEGEIPLKNKKVRLIQLSIEEDSCREISDIGHVRIYKTDRLGMPLIETVTYPDMVNPDEVKEAANYIRFLNRSTGKVRTGIGAGREDVNVSCKGGTRIEIKGVAHNSWIPELTHNECYRQWSLLHLRDELLKRFPDFSGWKIETLDINQGQFTTDYEPLEKGKGQDHMIVLVKLPGFKGILSHFTQPGKCFANEIEERLKVIACLELPNMIHSEMPEPVIKNEVWEKLATQISAGDDDALMIFWGPENDRKTALEVIQERCLMAFTGIPFETRKSFVDGTTIFERVLPGADRMYPDTDSAPIPLENDYIENLRNSLPVEVIDRYKQLLGWGVSEYLHHYLFRNNLVPMIEKAEKELSVPPAFTARLLSQRLKWIQGHYPASPEFTFEKVYNVLAFLKQQGIHYELAWQMLPELYMHPNMDIDSILTILRYKKRSKEEITAPIGFLKDKYKEIGRIKDKENEANWVMGQLRTQAEGNIPLSELKKIILSA
jgi:glutamyl-tRNA(Gln) amidotransferase subunit E